MKGKLLGLTGDPQVGKDTIADILVERYGYVKAAFADPLYLEVADAFGVTVQDLRSEQWKKKEQPKLAPYLSHNAEFIGVCKGLGLFDDEPLTSRRVLQIWGTEYRRHLYGADYWVGQMIGHLRSLRGKNVVFSDLRFEPEACMGHWHVSKGMSESFKIVRILRAGSVASAHVSDQGISKFLIDATIRNNNQPGDCVAELLTVLEKGQEGRVNDKG